MGILAHLRDFNHAVPMQLPPRAPVGKPIWTRSAQAAGVVVLNGGLLWVALWGWGKPFNAMQTTPELTIDLNRAEPAALMQIPGIGPNLAKRIAEHRPYKSVAELQNVPGIGPVIFESVRPFFHLGPTPVPQSILKATTHEAMIVEPSAKVDAPININTASAAELDALPGIGAKLAQRIIESRQRQPFTSIDDLDRVPGIGKKTIAKLRHFATTGKSKETNVAAIPDR